MKKVAVIGLYLNTKTQADFAITMNILCGG